MDTYVSTGTSLRNVGLLQEVPGLKKLAKVRGRSITRYQHHQLAESRDSQEMTKSEPETKCELPRNVTPQKSDNKPDNKVKALAMRFDKDDSGRQSVEITY